MGIISFLETDYSGAVWSRSALFSYYFDLYKDTRISFPLGIPRDWVDIANSAIFFLRIKTTSPNPTVAVCGNVGLLQNPFSHVS